jgi:type VI secretion system secreted protein VgrG
MLDYSQAVRPIQIHTPLGPDTFTVTAYQGEEYVSGLFHYRVELRSTDPAIDLQSLTGQRACLEIGLSGGQTRLVHGVISRMAQTGIDAGAVLYAMELRPWLWLLTMNADCRIFQNLSTPDIVNQVFSGLGFTDVAERLESSYAAREYCVQYNETAFDFVTRLFEEEGIFYFFEHTLQAHTLVLADSGTAWSAPAGAGSALVSGSNMGWLRENMIAACALEQAVTVGEVVTTDYNFETPSTSLLATTSGPGAARSVYGYPGRYLKQRDGETRTGIQLESLEAAARILRGQGTCRGFAAGARFTLEGHARSDANTDYAVLRLDVRGTQTEYTSFFEAIPVEALYRPPVRTRRPAIAGAQTATVTGKTGEEIWTDSYGRIKVKFHWDRSPAKDETSSCWVRVAQGWAGKSWGSFFLPRIGQEVVVSFLDGDPDRPLVTGCVYNAEQVLPYTLPADQTRSTIKSNSSKGGGGSNELRFEDKAGSEELYLHAQKDMNVEVVNQRSVTVQNADDLLTVSKGNRTITVSKGNETHTVKGTRTLKITGNETHTNSASYTSQVSGTYTLKVDGDLVIQAGGSITLKAGGSIQTTAGTSITSSAGTSLTNQAGTTLTNKGGAEALVDGGALVTIKGGLVKIN